MRPLSRRQFLASGARAMLALGLVRLARLETARAEVSPPASYGDWRDLYRARWKWDRVVRGTHTNANCVSSCAWNLYVREGIVWREEQSAPYAPSNASVPDWNPRGCQKGASCSDLMISSSRIRYPLRRVGPRGSGQWKKVGWEEALGEIARALVDTIRRRGGEGVVCEFGPNVGYGPNTIAALRLFRQIGAPITDSVGQIGDLPVGGAITLGAAFTDGSSDDWFRSDYLVLWAFNPTASRIPDAHYVNEARYRGARVVVIAPDYNHSAIHADRWLSPRPGTDAALALAACQVVLEEGLCRTDYVREQTDLPFLVRTDTRRFLREGDVFKGGRNDRFALWDEAAGELVWAPGTAGSRKRTLKLPDSVRPALEASEKIRLASGGTVVVQTVFSRLQEQLDRRFRPEEAAAVTGLAASTIRLFAREFARSGSALILSQFGSCKNYHSDLIQRSQILLASLTGNLGRPGGGWRSGSYVGLDGYAIMAMQDQLGLHKLAWLALRSLFDMEGVKREFESMFVPSSIFHAVHGGLGEVSTDASQGDPLLRKGAAPYLEEALAKGHFPVAPPPGAEPPEVVFSVLGNVLRHSRMGGRVRDTLFAKARLVVNVDFRMSETGRYSDFVLPAAGWYEKVGIKYIPSLVPYVTLGDRAVAPLAESKPEWEIFSRLAESIAAEARKQGVETAQGFLGQPCEIARLGERFSDGGRYGPDSEEDILGFMLSVSEASRGISTDDLRRDGGAVRIRSLGPQGGPSGTYCDYKKDEPVVPLGDFVNEKNPYPTLTGRQQFYIDHPWFLELGEELPTHKDPPAAGGDYPFVLTGAHTRWSIHAMWRDHDLMLRLQRGEPLVYLNSSDARKRGILDHGLVRVKNDIASFVARAKITGAIRPGQVHIFHAWEPYQFREGVSHQELAPSPIKVTQLVGDYGQLHHAFSHYEPNQVDRDTRVDIHPL